MQKWGEDHEEVAKVLSVIGDVHGMEKRHEDALDFFEQVKRLEHSYIISSLNIAQA